MFPYESNDQNIPTNTEAYYEAVAGQEEIYLEKVEEELRAILIFGDPTPSRTEAKRLLSDPNNDSCVVESLEEQLNQAAGELIMGDSDESPLSERGGLGDAQNGHNYQGLPSDI